MCRMTDHGIRAKSYPTGAGRWLYCEGRFSGRPMWIFAATMTDDDRVAYKPLYAVRIRAKWSRSCPA